MPDFQSASLLLLGQATVALLVAVFALVRRPSKATPSFVLAAVSAGWWSAAQAFHISSPSLGDLLFWGNATYWGIVTLPPAFLVFALRLSGYGAALSRTVVGALAVIPALSLWALYTNDTHHLFALGDMTLFGSRGEQVWEPGPVFWVHTAYSYASIGFALIVLARAVFTQSGVLSRQMALLLVSGAVPLMANAMRLGKVGTAGVSIDPTPFALLVSIVMLPFALGRLRLLDLVPGDRASAFARSPEALMLLDEHQRVTALSDQAAQVLGMAAGSVIGQRLESILPNSESALEAGRSTAKTEIRRGKDNQLIAIKVSPASTGAEGRERVVALRDETIRAREMTAAHVRYQDLFDDHPQAVLIHDPTSLRIVSANRAAERDYGCNAPELLNRTLRELWAPEDEAGLRTYLSSMGSTTPRTPAIHRRRNGSTFEVEIRSRAAVFDGADATVLIVDDVTERRLAERKALRLNAFVTTTAALWRSTVDSLPTPLLVLDGADRIFDLNRAAARHLGVHPRDAIGRPFETFCDQEPCRTARELALEARRTGGAVERHLDDLPGGGSCLVRCSPVSDAEDTATSRTVLLLQDTTQVVQLQRKMNNDAAFARLGAIVAAVAHDVRSPLAGLSVNLDALAIEKQGDPSVDAILPSLHRSIARINDLMTALLDYGRPTGEISRRGDLLKVATAAVNTSADLARRAGVNVEIRGGADIQARMERKRIQQAIENLVQNAIQHSPTGGSVVVELELERNEEYESALARCRVIDRGPGFRAEALPRVFEPFYSQREGGRPGRSHHVRARSRDAEDGDPNRLPHRASYRLRFRARTRTWLRRQPAIRRFWAAR